jgi:hypothetical protein
MTPLIESNSEIIKRGCTAPLYNQILIQHVKNAESMFSKLKDPVFLKDDFFYVLFQVYTALYCLRGKFTHFDLHANNILLQRPFPDGVIEFHYDDIVFHSPYVVKIIDYGRAETRITPSLIQEICKLCPACGKDVGFKTYVKNTDETSDMRLIHNLRDKLPQVILDYLPEELLDIFDTNTISECYEAFTTFLRHDLDNSNRADFLNLLRKDVLERHEIKGVLKIDTSLTTPFEWKIE